MVFGLSVYGSGEQNTMSEVLNGSSALLQSLQETAKNKKTSAPEIREQMLTHVFTEA